MGSPSRSIKRGLMGQVDKQVENCEPKNTERLKASLECILEPVPAGDPNFTVKPPHVAAVSDDRAVYISDYDSDLREEQNSKRSMIDSQSRHEEEQLSSTI